MIVQGVSIDEMLNQSINVLTRPGVATFEQYEKRGGMREALVYVGVAAALAAIVAFVFGLFGGFGYALLRLLGGFITPILGFFAFSYVLYWVGKQQGGTGTQDEVFYTISLYAAPIMAVNGIMSNIPLFNLILIPTVVLILSLYMLYLAYLAARSSMNLTDTTKAIISVVAALVAYWIVTGVVFSIFRAV